MDNTVIFYDPLSNIIFTLKTLFIIICTYYTSLKIISFNKIKNNFLINILWYLLIAVICTIVKLYTNYSMSIILLIFLLSCVFCSSTKSSIGYSLVLIIISLSINYSIYFISLVINFFIDIIINPKNDYFSLMMICSIHILFLLKVFKTRKFQKGILFLKNKVINEYFDILILNIAVTIVLATAIINNLNYINKEFALNIIIAIMVFVIIMFITIQKTLTMYYKHKKLIEELNETKEELEKTKKDRDKVEQENIEISKKSHSISHKIKSLNRKIDKLMMNSEIANEIDLKDTINKISKEYNKEKVTVELSKTGIELIDDMLNCMKDECIENNIEFELQLSGNIHHMTNNHIPKEELEILLADHIKDAIIAIKHTDNINRSILVRLGLIDDFYSLYIYDSGIEFEIDTLINLGTKPVTTHPDEGGTGMGFLNTFDTLKKNKASMVINEIGKPCKDNYTKIIMIKFDGKDEFKVKSYRLEEIKNININNNLVLI